MSDNDSAGISGKGAAPDKRPGLKRVLGDEWLDWNESKDIEEISETGHTFLGLSIVVMSFLLLMAALFWYLVLPRFEMFGRTWVIALGAVILGTALAVLIWYILIFVSSVSRKNYFSICLTRGASLFFLLFPLVMKLASAIGISRDRLAHSFILVSNRLAGSGHGRGPVLAIFPRCLRKDIKEEAVGICGEYPDVLISTAPGGTEARRVIKNTSPRAIVAVACERDLISGIQDVSSTIPVIGIPNIRPSGPCRNTTIDLEKFRTALEFFEKNRRDAPEKAD